MNILSISVDQPTDLTVIDTTVSGANDIAICAKKKKIIHIQ